MSSFYSYGHQQPTPAAAPAVSHTHHGSRNRRAPRVSSVSQNANKSFRNVRPSKDLGESLAVMNYRQRIEAIRSFDLEDDMEFCPALLTDSDVCHFYRYSDAAALMLHRNICLYLHYSIATDLSNHLPCRFSPSTALVHQNDHLWRPTPLNRLRHNNRSKLRLRILSRHARPHTCLRPSMPNSQVSRFTNLQRHVPAMPFQLSTLLQESL